MTRTTKLFAAGALTTLVLAISAPAQAQSPDAFERAVQSRQPSPTVLRVPDAIDRAVAAHEAQKKLAAIDARERALTERPLAKAVGPDAFERAVVNRTAELTAQTASMLDNRERALAVRPTAATQAAGSDGFDWGDFGVGAGVGIGLVLLLGLGTIALRRNERMSTA